MSIGLYIIIIGFLIIIGINNKDIINSIWPKLIKQLSLILSILSMYIIIYWWYSYETNINGYQLITNIYNISLGLDSISLYLILLTVIIIPISLLSNWNSIKHNIGIYNILILLLGIILLINYLCIDLLSFYIFFEISLIPLFILIGIYGANNKEKAAYYVLIFTFTSSLFMLLSIIVTTYIINTTSCLIYSQFILSLDLQILLWIGIMLGILVKTPLFPFHVWLPVVHSESPLGGSIILAGLILKLTVYLIIRWLLPFLAEASIIFYPTIYIICILTIIYTSLITLAQIDLKVIIAYSSISLLKKIGSLYWKNNKLYISKQTICRKLKICKISNILSTNIVSNKHNKYIKLLFIIKQYINKYSRLVKILKYEFNNPQIIKAFNLLVRISEAIRLLSINYTISIFNLVTPFYIKWVPINFLLFKNFSFNQNISINNPISNISFNQNISINNPISNISFIDKDQRFIEWLAGLIDGDGYFYYTKIGSCRLEITLDLRDEKCLYLIKQKYGGYIKLRSGAKAVRYNLHHKEGIIQILTDLNGLIRTPNRIEQFKKLCDRYQIIYKEPIKLEYNNAWFSGFFDADGSVKFNKANGTLSICAVQKNKLLIEELARIYNGKVYFHDKRKLHFDLIISKKENVLSLLNNYFHFNPSRSAKFNRLMSIKRYYELRLLKAHLAEPNTVLNKAWEKFLNNWNNYI